jgi:two-component system, OmpR family, response regulator
MIRTLLNNSRFIIIYSTSQIISRDPCWLKQTILTRDEIKKRIPMTETILIVDDSTFIVEGLVALLKKNYHPIPTSSGEECLEVLRTMTPSIIILDIMMEPMDGWETLARIKENPKTRHVPVLMFSAKKISPKEAEANRIIIDDFISKPVNPKKLLEAIERVLVRQEFNRRITETWNAAGVSPEIISEYLDVKTNLDVDTSLLVVMKKQLDLGHRDAENHEELVRSITVLEDRIGSSRARIEAFCKERGLVFPVLDREEILQYPPVPASGPAPTQISVSSGSDSPQNPVPDPDPIPEVKPLIPGPEVVPPVIMMEEKTQIMVTTPHSPQGRSVTADAKPSVTTAAPLMDTARFLFPADTQPPAHEADPVTAAVLHGTGPAGGASGVEGSGTHRIPPTGAGMSTAGHNSQNSLFDAPADGAPPLGHETGNGEQVSKGILKKRLGTGEERLKVGVHPGAGTQTPRIQSPSVTRTVQKPKDIPKNDQPSPEQSAPSSGTFFSRLIAAISRLFSRKKT